MSHAAWWCTVAKSVRRRARCVDKGSRAMFVEELCRKTVGVLGYGHISLLLLVSLLYLHAMMSPAETDVDRSDAKQCGWRRRSARG